MPSERVRRQIDRRLDQAEEAFEARQWQNLITLCDQILRPDQDNKDATTYLEAAGYNARIDGETSTVEVSPADNLGATVRPTNDDSERPASFATGRYRVSKFPGEGGKKRVYLDAGAARHK